MRLKRYKPSCHRGRMRYQGLVSPLGEIPVTCFPDTRANRNKTKLRKKGASAVKRTFGTRLAGSSLGSKSARPDYRICVLASQLPWSASGAWSARITGPGVDKLISGTRAVITSVKQLEIEAVGVSLQHLLWPGQVTVVSLDDSFGKSRKALDVLVPVIAMRNV